MRACLQRFDDDGFSLVEVLIAVVVLAVTGLALIDALQSNLLQSRKISTSTTSTITLATAVDVLQAVPYVSCATTSQPYTTLPSGFALPAGTVISVKELSPADATWQDCASINRSGVAGSAQQLSITTSDGVTRTLLRFASTATPTPTPTPTITNISASVSTSPSSVCGAFRNSTKTKACSFLITSTAGSGKTWHIGSVTFAGGSFANPAPTTPVSQSTQIGFSTYLLDGGAQCPRASTFPMSILLVDDGNGTTVSVEAVLTC